MPYVVLHSEEVVGWWWWANPKHRALWTWMLMAAIPGGGRLRITPNSGPAISGLSEPATKKALARMEADGMIFRIPPAMTENDGYNVEILRWKEWTKVAPERAKPRKKVICHDFATLSETLEGPEFQQIIETFQQQGVDAEKVFDDFRYDLLYGNAKSDQPNSRNYVNLAAAFQSWCRRRVNDPTTQRPRNDKWKDAFQPSK